ncbi:MAG TPA: hypothetical protein VNI02_18235, partial [Blastocatellia bacterium]|nr:hypothetical protein [Blastocatellia bacterium]
PGLHIPSAGESETILNQDVVNCPRCARRTAAARGACIYCGETLPITRIEAAPPQRKIDSFEHAFNTILEPVLSPTDESAEAAVAAALGIDLAEARAYVAAGKRVPLARSQNRQEAAMIAGLVRDCGFKAVVIPDEDFMLERELLRARRIVAREDGMQVDLPGGAMALPSSEIKLLVVGALKNNRVDYTEGVAGMRGQSGNVLDSSEFSSDETLIDVYTASLDRSFRIRSGAFDYSGLVSPLSFRAEVNFKAAVAKLREIAHRATFDDDFGKVSHLLARAWPARSRNEARGIKRKGLAYRPVAQASLITDNRDQFERYSRLMFVSTIRR